MTSNVVDIPQVYAWVRAQFGGRFPSMDELAVRFYQQQHETSAPLAHNHGVRREIDGKHDVPDSQYAGILKAAESGDAVNTGDLINALWWRIGNQRKEIARLHNRKTETTQKHPCACPEDGCGRLTLYPNQYCRQQQETESAQQVLDRVAHQAAALIPPHSEGGEGPTLDINLRPKTHK